MLRAVIIEGYGMCEDAYRLFRVCSVKGIRYLKISKQG